MHIEIETPNLDRNHFTNKNREGEFWYTVTQQALLFRDGEKYPDKFLINLYFESHKPGEDTDQHSVVALKPGKYHLDDKAFYVTNRDQLALDPTRLKAA